MVDHDKKVLWASTYHKGGSHDFSASQETKLHKKLKKKADWLHEKGFFILADSAYAIESFIIPPYTLAKSKSAEDNFNFYQFSARITLECAFGEIDLWWGIFWKRLNGSIDNHFIVIQGEMRIYKFLFDFRKDNVDEIRSDLNEDMYNFNF